MYFFFGILLFASFTSASGQYVRRRRRTLLLMSHGIAGIPPVRIGETYTVHAGSLRGSAIAIAAR